MMTRQNLPITLAVSFLFLWTSFAPASLAQAPPQPVAKKLKAATLDDFEKGPHTGPIEDALICIRVTGTNPNGTPLTPRFGNGFVLRCDGFILAPFDLFTLTPDSTTAAPSKLSIRVTLRPGTNQEQHIITPRLSRNYIDNMRRFGFAVFRLDSTVHVPAARTLLPDTLKAGDDVQVIWREVDTQTGSPGKLVRRTAHLAGLAEGVDGQGIVEDTHDHPGQIRLAESLEDVPAGAVVVGPEGMVIGIMPGMREANRENFVSLAALNLITNCVGPVPTTDNEYRRGNPEESDTGEKDKGSHAKMVKIPGGGVIVPKVLLIDQPDMEQAPVACVAPFEIDRLEVTNDEYMQFWNTFSQKQRSDRFFRDSFYPRGWVPIGEPYPEIIGNLPVVGVPLAGAKAYAHSHGKRLPTPYEWIKAAFGPKGDTETPEWIPRYFDDRLKAWSQLCQIHADHLRVTGGLLEFARHPIDENGKPAKPFAEDLLSLPWAVLPSGYAKEVLLSYNRTKEIIDRLNTAWQAPTSIIPVGERSYDVSPYGAEDMLLNAVELHLPNPRGPVSGGPRYFGLEWERVRSEVLLTKFGFKPKFLCALGPQERFFEMGKYSRLINPHTWIDHTTQLSPAVYLPWLLGLSNMAEAAATIWPFQNWACTIEGYYMTNQGPPGRMAALAEWRGAFESPRAPSTHSPTLWITGGAINYTREIGYPLPSTNLNPRIKAPDFVLPNMADLHGYYNHVVPVGFRCAR